MSIRDYFFPKARRAQRRRLDTQQHERVEIHRVDLLWLLDPETAFTDHPERWQELRARATGPIEE